MLVNKTVTKVRAANTDFGMGGDWRVIRDKNNGTKKIV